MRFSNKAISMELLKMLSSLSYAAFQSYCRDIIAEVLPNTVAAKEMRKIDSAGIDLFLLSDSLGEIEYGFQCKGIEVPHFKENQVEQCIHSIRSLKKLDFKLKNYYLIINRDVYKEEKEIIESELEKIKELGKLEKFKLLDIRGFINFLSDFITINFKAAILESNQTLYKQYRQSLNQQFYYANVPFELNEHQLSLNPSAFLENGLQIKMAIGKKTESHYEPSKYFFVIGDFGFGKTSLMFQSMLKLNEYNALYIPLSYFKKRDFQNQLEFVMVINKLVTGEENDIRNLFVKFKSRVLAHLLANDPKLVLLFDGMDENLYLGTAEGLRILFSILNPIKAKCIFSMRKTFWDERSGNFAVALPKRREHKDRIKLLEWENKQILEFVNIYQVKYSITETARKNLKEFENIIRQGKYQKYYGDIPKRPLFLDMIVRDVADGNIKETSLAELYEKYFLKKFIWDTESKFAEIPAGRPVTYTDDIYKGFANMCLIMEQVAGMMIDDSNEVVFLNTSIDESVIEPFLTKYNIINLQTLLLNSVLTTHSTRTVSGVQVGFAHRSFQEYFTARYLCKAILNQSAGWDIITRLVFPDTVYSFMVNYLEWKHRDENILMRFPFKELTKVEWVYNSVGDILLIVLRNHSIIK